MFRARFDDAPEIGLEELVESVARTADPNDVGSLAACAPLLAGFARRPGIVSGLINKTIGDLLSARLVAPIRTPQSFVLAIHELFYVRCNLWAPLAPDLRSKSYQERLYSLEVPHDHNFSFLTVGYLGPGYSTDLFEYDRRHVEGRIGETVDLRPAGTVTLTPGDVMLYREGVDVHVQHQPPEMSASLNIMFLSEFTRREWQYIFDLPSRTITGLSGNAMRSRHELMMLAGEVGDAETMSLLEDVDSQCACPSTRRAAVAALNNLASGGPAGDTATP
jgi:hypothetical protein